MNACQDISIEEEPTLQAQVWYVRKRTNVRRLPVVTEEPASMAITPMNVIVETDSWASIVKILSIIALSKTRV